MARRPQPASPVLRTLPDYLAPGLRLVFVGINPGLFSVERGHYFARPTNRFWPAFSRSRLSEAARQGLRVARLRPEHDAALLRYGIGFTDVVKQPTRDVAALKPADYAHGAPQLRERLLAHAPVVACFHGVTGYRAFLVHALARRRDRVVLGLQPEKLGEIDLFVVPNPSPANAHSSLADQTAWYDRLAAYLGQP